MNIHQMYHLRHHYEWKVAMLKWSIDTIQYDLSVYKMPSEMRVRWEDKVKQKKHDFYLFKDEIEILTQQIDGLQSMNVRAEIMNQ